MDVRTIVYVLCATTTLTWSYIGNQNDDDGRYFTYSILNEIKPPYFNVSMRLHILHPTHLIRYMEESVMMNSDEFKGFTVTFRPRSGYVVDSINNAFGNNTDTTYWQLSNSSRLLDAFGVSNYVPSPGDNILFNFTTRD